MKSVLLMLIGVTCGVLGCDGESNSTETTQPESNEIVRAEVAGGSIEEPEEEVALNEETVSPDFEGEDVYAEGHCDEVGALKEDAESIEGPAPSLGLNLFNPDDNLTAFTKMRGSLNPDDEVVFYWKGNIYAVQDADPLGTPISEYPSPILKFEGFNIARFEKTFDGVRMVSREMSVYRNTFGTIIDCWDNWVLNPEEPSRVPVVHVWNDPVNFTLGGGTAHEVGEQVIWTTEMLLRYPSPLPVEDFPDYSAGNTYESAEMFNWYSKKEDLNNPELDSVPVTISWSRVGQFLPWMQMGQTPGKLVYHTFGHKLMGGVDELPESLKAYVMEKAPKFLEAPSVDTSPNDTSWRVFKKLVESGDYSPECAE